MRWTCWLVVLLGPALAPGCRQAVRQDRAGRGLPAAAAVRFTDVSEAAGIQFRHESGASGRFLFPETFGAGGAFLDYDPELFERTIAGTLTSGFHMAQLVARHMVERGGGGRIVFISSVHAEMPQANSVAYNAAKAGLNHLMRTIAVELSPHRINVNAIEPGWIDTPGERATFSEEVIEREKEKLPWGRLGQPEEIGKAAAFLCSSDADYITGTVLPVDGCFRFKDSRAGELVPR